MLVMLNRQLSLPLDIREHTSGIANQIDSAIGPCVSMAVSRLHHSDILFGDGERELTPIGGWPGKTLGLSVRQFSSISKPVLLAGIDSSCISIGETQNGSVFAGRLAIVFAYAGLIQSYVRFGPILVYVDEESALALFQGSRMGQLARLVLLDRAIAQRMVRTRLEHAAAVELAEGLSGSILMLDGALLDSPFDQEGMAMRDVVAAANRRGNQVVGISKATRVKFLAKVSSELLNCDPPAFADAHMIARCFSRELVGRVLVAKFTADALPLRVDVAACGDSLLEDVLSDVRANDTFTRGYPESLRLAHHLSVFSRHEALCIESYLVKNAALNILCAEDLRRSLLGEIKTGRLSRGGSWS